MRERASERERERVCPRTRTRSPAPTPGLRGLAAGGACYQAPLLPRVLGNTLLNSNTSPGIPPPSPKI